MKITATADYVNGDEIRLVSDTGEIYFYKCDVSDSIGKISEGDVLECELTSGRLTVICKKEAEKAHRKSRISALLERLRNRN